MYRNMERHSFPVACRHNPDDATEVMWYWVEGMVQPFKLDETVVISGDVVNLKQYVKVYTKSDKPSNVIIRTPTAYLNRSAYMFWPDANGTELPYGSSQEQEFTRMGRDSFNKYACTFDAQDSVGNGFRKPPAFQDEYVAFLDSVGGIARATSLVLQPLAQFLEENK